MSENVETIKPDISYLEQQLGSMKSFLFDYFQKLGPDPLKNIQEIVNSVGKIFNSAATLYNRLDEDDGMLKTWAIDLAPPNFQHVDKPDGHVCYLLTIKERTPSNLTPVEIPDLDSTPFKELDINVKNYNLKSYLAFPVALNEKVVGSLCIVFGQQRTFSQIDKDILEAFAKAVTLEEERKYANELVQKQIVIIRELKDKAEEERDKSEKLLLNILPEDVAQELKEKGHAEPQLFKSVTVMFTDFKGFTAIAENLSPHELVEQLDACFRQFDKISERYKLEKLKTIGDSYMCAGGLPKITKTHPIDAILAALEIKAFMDQMKSIKESLGVPFWELRIGIHTGSLVAGVVGEKKFAYDVWGDTVNTASRMESSGSPGQINISKTTYDLIKDFFDCEVRGKIPAKNKGEIEMYFVKGIKRELQNLKVPNDIFWEKYKYFKV